MKIDPRLLPAGMTEVLMAAPYLPASTTKSDKMDFRLQTSGMTMGEGSLMQIFAQFWLTIKISVTLPTYDVPLREEGELQ
jgi:hypothetical protein